MTILRTPMRDGVDLVADLFLPDGEGPHPCVLVRTPYGRRFTGMGMGLDRQARFFAANGYAVVLQDVRGRGDSEGTFRFFANEGEDGFDTIEWLAAQSWCDGRVGMLGTSYVATSQWLAARERPPHLVCIIPTSAAGRYPDELPFQGGALLLEWAAMWEGVMTAELRPGQPGPTREQLLSLRPLSALSQMMGGPTPAFDEFIAHPVVDDYWRRIRFSDEDFAGLVIPSLHILGSFDEDQPGALTYWRGMQRHSPARDHQFLVWGPWNHAHTSQGGETSIGDFEFTDDSVVDLDQLHLAFFDRYLAESSSTFNAPPVRIYVTGSNSWREEVTFPLTEEVMRPLFLHSGGAANTLDGDGRLSWDEPREEPEDHYVYDPTDPVTPTMPEGFISQARGTDQRYLERRRDVLVYTTDVLESPVEVVGATVVELYAASDARDTDFTARLLDVQPDGRALQLGPWALGGVVRARFRNGGEREELLEPGRIERYRIDLRDLAHTFSPGHRIRLEISSSYAPVVHPNPNTGDPIATDADYQSAHQTVFHRAGAATHVRLPVINTSSTVRP
ncbi:CocE/NonD family hydrolase [Microbacterium sp. RD1]|uniref:CocE/NonD family hydrolase n=1 Tax=Microbacterium sp. RD1 TaxID=3457313 RepID=UPI003FA60E8B